MSAQRPHPSSDDDEGEASGSADAASGGVDRRTMLGWLTRRELVALAVSAVLEGAGSVALAGSGLFDLGNDATARFGVPSAPTAADDIATGLTRWPVGRRERAPGLRGRT